MDEHLSPAQPTREDRLERLLRAYSHHYDILRDVEVEGGSYPAAAIYYLRDENYLISKQYVLNAVENHEYVYFYLTEHLDAAELQRQIEKLEKNMREAARMMEYEYAAVLRDEIIRLRGEVNQVK